MTTVAAIDCGTNAIRLLVAEVGPDGTLTDRVRLMRTVRLGEGVDRTGAFAESALTRTFAAVDEYAAIISTHDVERVRFVATSASRDVSNRTVFVDGVRSRLGVDPEVISGQEEAALSFAGAVGGLPPGLAERPTLVVDIGGGSTEFVLGTDAPEGLISVDMGCVRITEQFLHSDPPAPEELSTAVSIVRDHLTDVERAIPGLREAKTLVGLAGTVSTVAAVEQGLHEYARDRIHHFRLTRAAVEDVFRTLATEAADDRRHNPGLEAERVDVIVGGVAVLATVMRTFEFDEALVPEEDILDGLVRDLAGR